MNWSFLEYITGKKQPVFSEWYEEYRRDFICPAKETTLSRLSYVVFDTETTGLDIKTDHIISLGAVKIQNQELKMLDVFSQRIKRSVPQKEEAIKVHGLIQTDIKGSEARDVLSAFFHYLGSSVVVGHHVSFDADMVNKLSSGLGGGPIKNPILDTSFLAKRLDNPLDIHNADNREYSLDALCNRFHIVTKDRHTALGDAYLTALLFMKLMKEFEKKGVKNLGQILR